MTPDSTSPSPSVGSDTQPRGWWTFRRRSKPTPADAGLNADQISAVLADPTNPSVPCTCPPPPSPFGSCHCIPPLSTMSTASALDTVHHQDDPSHTNPTEYPSLSTVIRSELAQHPLCTAFLLGSGVTAMFVFGAGLTAIGLRRVTRLAGLSPRAAKPSTRLTSRSLSAEPLVSASTPTVPTSAASAATHAVPNNSGIDSLNRNAAVIETIERLEARLVQAESDRKKETEMLWRELASTVRASHEQALTKSAQPVVWTAEEIERAVKEAKEDGEGETSEIVARLDEFNLIQALVLDEMRTAVAKLEVSLEAQAQSHQATEDAQNSTKVTEAQTAPHAEPAPDAGVMSMDALRQALDEYRASSSISDSTHPAAAPISAEVGAAESSLIGESDDAGLYATQGDFDPTPIPRGPESPDTAGFDETFTVPKRGRGRPRQDASVAGIQTGEKREANQAQVTESAGALSQEEQDTGDQAVPETQPRPSQSSTDLPPTSFPPTPFLGIDDTGSWRIPVSLLPLLPSHGFPLLDLRLIEERSGGYTARGSSRSRFWVVERYGMAKSRRMVPVQTVVAVTKGKVDMVHLDGGWWRCSLEGEYYVLREKIDDGAR